MNLVIPVPRGIDRQIAAIRRDARVVFFGTPLFSVPALRRLHEDGWPVAMVVTAPDKPSGRRMTMTPSPVKAAAEELELPVRTPATLKDEAFWMEFSELRPDLCVVVAYNKILPKRYLDVPRLGFVNIHPSLLPAYRGPSPVQTAILDGQASTGVSIMVLDEDMDHGPILVQEPFTIPAGLDSPAAHDELFRIGADMLLRTLPDFCAGKIAPQPQDHTTATFTRKFTREDGKLNWGESSGRINDRIRALGANPGAWTTSEGKTLNIFHAHPADGPTPELEAGTVFVHNKEIAVAAGSGALILETIQMEGGKRMLARDFVNGRREFVGSRLI